jgi:hypothetical protein
MPAITRSAARSAPSQEPTFHPFLDLPHELREMVYAQYFIDASSIDEPDSVAMNGLCISGQAWPHVHIRGPFKENDPNLPGRKTQLPFLPAVCYVNDSTGTEATICLFRRAEVSIKGYRAAKRMEDILSKRWGRKVLENIHFLALAGIDEGFQVPLPAKMKKKAIASARKNGNNLSWVTDKKLHSTANQTLMRLLDRCPNIRTLILVFDFVTSLLKWPAGPDYQHVTWYTIAPSAFAFRDFMFAFDLRALLRCPNLRKLKLSAIGLESFPDTTLQELKKWYQVRGKSDCTVTVYVVRKSLEYFVGKRR